MADDPDIGFEPDAILREAEPNADLWLYRTAADKEPAHRYTYEVGVLVRNPGADELEAVYAGVQTDELITYGAAIKAAVEIFASGELPGKVPIPGTAVVTAGYDNTR